MVTIMKPLSAMMAGCQIQKANKALAHHTAELKNN